MGWIIGTFAACFIIYLVVDAEKVARQNRAAEAAREAEKAAAETDRLRKHPSENSHYSCLSPCQGN